MFAFNSVKKESPFETEEVLRTPPLIIIPITEQFTITSDIDIKEEIISEQIANQKTECLTLEEQSLISDIDSNETVISEDKAIYEREYFTLEKQSIITSDINSDDGENTEKAAKHKRKRFELKEQSTIISDVDSNDGKNTEKTVKYKRKIFSLELKIRILNDLRKNKLRYVSLKYGISERSLRKWRRREDKLRELYATNKKHQIFEEINNSVYVWFKDTTDEGIILKSSEIRKKALDKCKEVGGDRDFFGSDIWFHSWKSTYNINEHLYRDDCGIRILGGEIAAYVQSIEEEKLNTEEKAYTNDITDEEAIESLEKAIRYFEYNKAATNSEMDTLHRLKIKAEGLKQNDYRKSPEFFACD